MPALSSAQAKASPTLIWVRVLPDNTPAMFTATGTWLSTPRLLFPSWPAEFRPQQYAWPVLSSAQVKFWPAPIWVRVLPDSTPAVSTATAVACAVPEEVLLPSSPLVLSPQQ